MEISGTVTKAIRRVKPYGSVFMTVDIDQGGSVTRMRYLHGAGVPEVRRGDKITLAGMPIMGRKDSNVGGVRITVHDRPA
jgi:hypothetical protein